ncbi:MAG: (Fe-S)-binding protein [Chloroflexota bacterium]|nr:(Fe-S)-binding protein [Chloroflexota bacterium]
MLHTEDISQPGALSPLELLLQGALNNASIPLGSPPTGEPLFPAATDAPDYDNLLACIRCGACLPVCPTYATDLLEVQSPRGRVQLMRQVDEGLLEPSENFLSHMYHCLDCRACQTACPTGVRIGEQVLRARVQMEKRKPTQHIVKRLGLQFALGDQRRLEWLMLPVALYQRSGLQRLVRGTRLLHRVLPERFKLIAFMEELLPERIPIRSLRKRIAVVVPPQGERRYRVGFFLGCVMSTVFAETSQATVRVLSENGCEVITPKTQRCCGAPHAEEGDFDSVKLFARENIALFERYNVDYIICDCAACGAQTKEYGELLHDDPLWRDRAARFSSKVRDIMQFIGEIPLKQPHEEVAARVAYHEACHLCHAQKVKKEPVAVLQSLPGVDLVPLVESDMCCGSAGIYNLTHNDRSMQILDRKMANIEATDAQVVLAGNPGCLLQLDYGRRASRSRKPVLHPVQLVDAAYRAERLQTGNPARFVGIDAGRHLRTKSGRILAVTADGKTRIALTRGTRKERTPASSGLE